MKKYLTYLALFSVGAATGYFSSKKVIKCLEIKKSEKQQMQLHEKLNEDYTAFIKSAGHHLFGIESPSDAVNKIIKDNGYSEITPIDMYPDFDRVRDRSKSFVLKYYGDNLKQFEESVKEKDLLLNKKIAEMSLHTTGNKEDFPREEDDDNPYGAVTDSSDEDEEPYIHTGNELSFEDDMYTDELPFVITEAEFENEFMEREKTTLIWYDADSVLAEEVGNKIISNIDDIVGVDILYNYSDLGESGDIVYVRNNRLETDYMLIRQPKSYAEEILGEVMGYSYDDQGTYRKNNKVRKVGRPE